MGFSVRDDVLAFAVFPFVIWAAIRFRIAGTSVACFLIAAVAVWGTAQGFGPFVSHKPLHNAVLLQLFLAVIAITGLMLAAVINERSQAEYALRSLSGRLLHLQDEERRKLARELHDSTGQGLVALQMNLAAIRQQGSLTDARTSQILLESGKQLRRAGAGNSHAVIFVTSASAGRSRLGIGSALVRGRFGTAGWDGNQFPSRT